MSKALKKGISVAVVVGAVVAGTAGAALAGQPGSWNGGGQSGKTSSDYGWYKNADKACASDPFWGCA